MCGVKIIAAIILLIIKIFEFIGRAVADVAMSIFGLIKYAGRHFAAGFRRISVLTEELAQSLREAKKDTERRFAPVAAGHVVRYLFREGGLFYTVFNYALPIVSVAFLVAMVNYGSGLEYGICVEYNGKQLGVISDERDFNTASKEVLKRISYAGDESGELNFAPTMSLKIVSEGENVINSAQLVERLLAETPYDLVDAYGIYIDGEFFGAVAEKKPVEDALASVLANYKVDGMSRNLSFKNKVTYSKSTYLADSVMPQEEAVAKMTESRKSRVFYVVSEGESPATICQKYNMTLEEFYAINPVTLERGCFPGEYVTVIETSSFLPIQYIRDLEAITFIGYESVDAPTSALNLGKREILTKGQRGEKKSKFEVLYVDGIERSRIVTESVMLKDPVVEVIGVGTYTAKPASSATKLYGNGMFSWPVDGGYISDEFISDRNHKGMDIAAPAGREIYAGADGIVAQAGWNTGGYGNFVMIDHLNGYVTIYGHASVIYVEKDQVVRRGQVIAGVGTTGISTGNHLHFEVQLNGSYCNPADYLNTVD